MSTIGLMSSGHKKGTTFYSDVGRCERDTISVKISKGLNLIKSEKYGVDVYHTLRSLRGIKSQTGAQRYNY